MRLESEIQRWIVTLAKEGFRPGVRSLSSVLRYDDSPIGQEMKAEVKDPGGVLSSRHRAVHDACRVLRSLVEPRFRSANEDISSSPGETLRPDLVLVDEISGAFVIVELKRSKKAAREFATELLAYAHCLIKQHPGSSVFLVLVSTSWASLEQHAIAELALRDIPVLALEFRDIEPGELTPTLRVRSDLLPVASVSAFPAQALLVDTKVFMLPRNWQSPHSLFRWRNRIEHAATGIAREAQRQRASGFVLVWHPPDGWPSGSFDEPGRVFVSVAIRNACRPQEFAKLKTAEEARSFAWANNFYDLADDIAVRLLCDLELCEKGPYESAASEGTWADLLARLQKENAMILRFEAFGEIGDQVSNWRTQKRYGLRPLIPDITSLPAWHPLTWLAALESLIDVEGEEVGDALAWHAFRCGENLSKLRRSEHGRWRDNQFGWAADQARFARTWCDFFASQPKAPKFFPTPADAGLRLKPEDVERAIAFASDHFLTEGELPHYCFALGCHVGSRWDIREHLRSRRDELRRGGVEIPQELEALGRQLG